MHEMTDDLEPVRARHFTRRFACMIAIAAAAAIAAPVAMADDASDEPRFELTRTADFLFRIDTASGQVWAVPVSGDGGWQVMGAVPDPGTDVSVPGIFKITTMKGTGGPHPKSLLLRTDLATGRAWIATALPDGKWVQIAEPPAVVR